MKTNSSYSKYSLESRNQGFTLFELLIVIIIIGILAAVGLPQLLSRTASAKQAGAQQLLGAINRGQVIYYFENNRFANNFDALVLGSLTGTSTGSTGYFTYAITVAADLESVAVTSSSPDIALKSYSAGSSRFTNSAGVKVTAGIICENLVAGTISAAIPTVSSTSSNNCPSSTRQLY